MLAADLLTERARLTPDREALYEIHTGQRYTYAELNARANRAAHFLRDALGVQIGDRVSVLAHNSVVYLDLLYGAAKIGAIFAPLNWRLTANELEFILQDSAPRVLFVGPEFAETARELQARAHIQHWIGIEGALGDNALAYETESAKAADAEPTRAVLNDETPCCLLYTSGTTGKPKGALIPQRQVVANCVNTVSGWELNADDVSPILTPLFHSGGLFAFLTPILYAGGRVVLARTFEADASLRVLIQEKCTVVLGVPTLFQLWQDTPLFEHADFSHVRFFINGGAPIAPAIVEFWHARKQVSVRQGYGLTEVGVNCFMMSNQDAVQKIGSVGKPIVNTAMKLIDPATQREVENNRDGELLIRGAHVCLGYWHNPRATDEALREGWFHTGDIARRDADGFYTIVGRYKDMLKSGGENIYAAEVEAVFREFPSVADAALIGMPDSKWGEVGLIVIAPKSGETVDMDALMAYCNQRLARFKMPKRFVITDALPYSPYGKVEKQKLKNLYVK